MLEIYGGRKEFYQWDINQYVIVDDTQVKEIHFDNFYCNEAMVVEVKDGMAEVPNILLQYATYICAYAFCGECVRYEAKYKVNQRVKPADYVYTETEIKRYEDLEQRIANLEKGGSADIDLSDYYTKEETNTAIQENKYTLPAASADTLGGVMVGDGLVMDGEVLSVKPEGVYELIEEIVLEEAAVIDRTEEPDGTPYAFTKLKYDVETNLEKTDGYTLYYYLGTNGDYMSAWQTALSGNTGALLKRAYSEIKKNTGEWRAYSRPWQTNYDVTSLYESTKVVDAKIVTRIRTSIAIPAGVTIRIKGVRA